jgi:hypothetical protein
MQADPGSRVIAVGIVCMNGRFPRRKKLASNGNRNMEKPVHKFSAVQRDLRDKFAASLETRDEWIEIERIGEGESESWRVRNALDEMIGVAKPGPPRAAQDNHFRAAHEKIAFDLAHLISLPVPPVVLWAEGIGTVYKVGRSISCWAFPQGTKWSNADSKGLISSAQKRSVAEVASAMRVFHTWIGDGDRKPDHVFVDLNSPPGHLNVAYFDHGNSMMGQWTGPGANYLPGSLDRNCGLYRRSARCRY